jgi:hypothetical protein
MGVRTRGLDVKAGAAKLKADRAARLEAELVIDRWNRRLATGRDMLWSPTIRAALIAGTPWLDVFCPGRGTSRAIDLRPHVSGCRAQSSPPAACNSLFILIVTVIWRHVTSSALGAIIVALA